MAQNWTVCTKMMIILCQRTFMILLLLVISRSLAKKAAMTLMKVSLFSMRVNFLCLQNLFVICFSSYNNNNKNNGYF